MKSKPTPQTDACPPGQELSPQHDRRDFLVRVATRATYVAPVVIALSSHKGMAHPLPCVEEGSPCSEDADCCSGLTCQDAQGDPVMQGGMGTCELP